MYRQHPASATTAALFPDDALPAPVLAPLLPSLEAARARLAQVRPATYASTRNALDGAVTGLSPYITHGMLSLREVLQEVHARHPLPAQHKLVFELGWRAFYRHVWQHRGEGIFRSLHDGPLPDAAYAREMPADIRTASTGVPVVDCAVRALYATGTLHNHARMWLASYVVHLRKVHWRAGADWLYGHLLDGDLASNHLSWQWVAGTGSVKPYLFNADNVARYAPPAWHSPGSALDTSYEALDQLARSPDGVAALRAGQAPAGVPEPDRANAPPQVLGATAPHAADVAGRNVWLVHPWSLGALPAGLPADTLVLGLYLSDFHTVWPWSATRWHFVGTRMQALAPVCWHGDAASVAQALRTARQVQVVDDPHLQPWLPVLARSLPPPALFREVARPCASFSQWWSRVSSGMRTAADVLARSAEPI